MKKSGDQISLDVSLQRDEEQRVNRHDQAKEIHGEVDPLDTRPSTRSEMG